jgi:hypothetical protein
MIKYTYIIKNITYLLILLAAFIISGCSAGSSNTQQQTYSGYLVFNESNITLDVGESEQITLSLMNTNAIPNTPLRLYSSESGIVLLSPDICILNDSTPPSCDFVVTGVKAGVTQISTDGIAPQQPMSVTVSPMIYEEPH